MAQRYDVWHGEKGPTDGSILSELEMQAKHKYFMKFGTEDGEKYGNGII